MRHHLRRFLVGSLPLLALTLLCASGPTWPANDWPVKKFEVFLGPPTASNFDLGITADQVFGLLDNWVDIDSPTDPPPDVPAAAIAEIESYLGEVAQMLDDMGFAPPLLVPMVKTAAGEPAYRVYYYAYNGAPARYRSSECGKFRPTIHINANRFLNGTGQISPKNYQDLAHELFHGVQGAYRLFSENCGQPLGRWITEGTAQALGADLAAWSSRHIDPEYGPGDWIFHRWGLRFYDRSLSARRVTASDTYEALYPGWEQFANVTYGASSFWRFVGEWVATGGGAGTAAVKPDYSYLIKLFDSSLGGAPGWDTELAWLDGQLADHPRVGLGLERIYPDFISTYAAYMTTRIKTPIAPSEARDAFLRSTFPERDCPLLRVNDSHPVVRAQVEIEPVAAECLRLELAYSYPTDIEISLSNPSKAALRALAVGTENGQVVTQPVLIPVQDGWRASFILNVKVSMEPVVFIIANVADEAGRTRRIEAGLQIAPTRTGNSLAPQGPVPPQPPPGPGNTAGNAAADGALVTMFSQSGRVGQQIKAGLQSLNPNLAHSNTVSRQPDQPPCEDAFKVHSCGPHTSISLSMVPGMYGSMTQATGRGGAFGQFTSMMAGVAAAGPAEASSRMQEMAEYVKSVDGTDVNITIPLIDYGFTGSFNNARLTVSARGGSSYQAIGPGDIQPGPGHEYPLSGRVTIEEYTPTLLRGTYSGGLVDMERIDWANVGDDFTLPVHETIQGNFQIVAAWRGDDRIHAELAEDAVASVYRDVAEMMPGLDPQLLQSIQQSQQGAAPGPDASGGAGTGGDTSVGIITPGCDCSCNAAPDPKPECERACGGTYAACKGLVATAVMRPSREDLMPTVEKAAADPFLRTLPNACDLLSAPIAAGALGASDVRPSGVRDHLAQVTSQCAWRDPQGKVLGLTMMFQSLAVYDSRKNSLEELQIKVRGFNLNSPLPPPLEGVGNVAFGLHDRDTTSLVVLTGVYGTAMDKGDFTTELLATFKLTDAGRSPEERLAGLVRVARPQLERLQRLAMTTHEGDPGH